MGTGDYGVYINNVSNVEVRNGTVRGFGRGISAYWSGTATKSNRVVNVRAMGNGYGIYLISSYNNLVKDCSAADNTASHGIYVGPGSTVTNNTACYNQSDGIRASFGCTVTNNTVYNNQGYGISTGDGSTLINNTAYNNQSRGISASYGSTVTQNTAYNNQDYGIYTGDGCTLTNNTAYSNNQSNSAFSGGIQVYAGCIVKNNSLRNNLQRNIVVGSDDNVIEENLVTGSGYGIYFITNGNFFANNRARNNPSGNFYNGGSQWDGGGNVGF